MLWAMEPVWIDTDAAHTTVVASLRHATEYALDTEFHGEKTYFPKLALVQIAWDGGLALIDPLAISIEPLAEILDGPATMVVHAGDQDLAILGRATGSTPKNMFDTQIAAGFCGMGTPSLLHLAERLAEVEISKGDRLTDWTKRPLTENQRIYAAGDVLYLLHIANRLRTDLAKRDRLPWAELECEERLQRNRAWPDPRTAWWKLKGHRQLRGKSRGVAQEVAAWREIRGAELDQPTRFILSDLAMAGVISRPPRNRDELAAVRGIDGRVLKDNVASGLLAAIELGTNLTTEDLILPARDDTDRTLAPAVSVIAAWLNQRASELKIESSLLASRSDLTELINSGEGRLADGWRMQLVGEPIRQLLHGEAVVRLTDGGRRVDLQSAPAPAESFD